MMAFMIDGGICGTMQARCLGWKTAVASWITPSQEPPIMPTLSVAHSCPAIQSTTCAMSAAMRQVWLACVPKEAPVPRKSTLTTLYPWWMTCWQAGRCS